MYVCCTHMKRFNFFIENKWILKLKREARKEGISTSALLRKIITQFFKFDGSDK